MLDPSYLNLYVFATLFCWGIWGIVDKKALSHAKQEDVMMRLYVLSVLWIPISYCALNILEPGWALNAQIILWTGLASCAYAIALLAYLAAMSLTEASYVLGITAAYPLIFQFLAHLVLGERLIPERLIGALVIGFGLFLISSSPSSSPGGEDAPAASQQASKQSRNKILLYVIIATLTWGVYGLFDKKAVMSGPPLLVFFSKTCWDFLLFFALLLMYHLRKTKIDWKNKISWQYCAFSEFALGFGGLTYLAALSMASASYVITITGCYPLLMYLLAIWLLKEQFNKMRFTGILLVVLGGTLVQLTATG
jgi:drug/metabolite transporter (DMT)-like permease